MPAAVKKKRAGIKKGEPLLDYIARRLKSDPPWEINDVRLLGQPPSTWYGRRASRVYGLAGQNITIGGYEVYSMGVSESPDSDGQAKFQTFRADISEPQMRRLRCELGGREFLTPQDRRARTRANQQARIEEQRYGARTTTATIDEKRAKALILFQGDDPESVAMRERILADIGTTETPASEGAAE